MEGDNRLDGRINGHGNGRGDGRVDGRGDRRPDIRVMAASHLKSEEPPFRCLREKGQNAINFIHFLTPVTIQCNDVPVNTTKNACIIYTPGTCQDYRTERDALLNNFVTFKTNASEFLSLYDLPLNEPFYIKDDAEVTRCVEYIAWASANRMESLENEITDRVLDLFALLMKIQAGATPKSQRDAQAKQRFIALRGEIRMNPRGWTVGKMASAVWLTRSRFYVAYKGYFGVTPSDDLTDALLDYARERLLRSDDSIAAIAEDCGYKHTESFIRIFNTFEGVTPGQFRKRRDG